MSKYVGKPSTRYDGIGHVAGRTIYTDDVEIPGMLYVKVFRSPVHKGLIRNLDVSGAEKVTGVAGVVTAADIPNNAYGMYADQPVFVDKQIRFKGERIAAVAAVDEDTAVEALSKIKLDVEEQTPVFDVEEAMKSGAASMGRPEGNLWGGFNNGTVHRVRLGDVEKGFAESDQIIEGTYTTAFNEHAPMEPQASVAYIDSTDRLVIHTCSQDLYFHLGFLCGVFGLPMNKIRYVGGTIGGGFGGKNEIHCDHVTGALALKLRRPVKYRLTRREETLYTSKRGYFKFHFKDGVKNDGRILARQVTSIHDSGSYGGMGPYAVEKNSMLVAGPYNIPNVAVDGYCVFTNKPVGSSMRGFAIINGTSTVELQMNRLAEKLGLSPWEFRLMNAWRNGDLTATQVKVEACAAVEVLQKAAELAGVDLPAHLKAMSSDRR